MKKREVLEKLEILKDVESETVSNFTNVGKIVNVPKGKVLIRARDPVPAVYFQISGKSIIYNLTHNGKRKILFILGQGALLNEHVFNEKESSVYAETIEDSKILKIPTAEFVRLMEKDFKLTKNVFDAQERKIWRLSHQLKNTMSSIYLQRKLAAKLWKLARDFGFETEDGIEIDVNMSVTFLADMMGIPRETTSRICSELIELGLMKISKKRITITNPEKMAKFYETGKIE